MENLQKTNDVSQTIQETLTQNQLQQSQNVENSDLILGKFKTVDDLKNAYKNMESQQGQQSKELGDLRKKTEQLEQFQKQKIENVEKLTSAMDYMSKHVAKYDKDEYLKNPEFGNLFTEAFLALGTNLDIDKFVSLTDKYVQARINMYEKSKLAKTENEEAKSSMQFSGSDAKSSTKTLLLKVDTMPLDKIDEFVAKYI